jgi:hypothetical protein
MASMATLLKGRKIFFSEEKKQKTFVRWQIRSPDPLRQSPKVFWFFFSKKNRPSHDIRSLRLEYAYIGRQTIRLKLRTKPAITTMPSSTRALSPAIIASWI